MEQRTCPECGKPAVRRGGKQGLPPIYCSPSCRARAGRKRAKADGRHAEQLAAANTRAAAERAANQKPCPYCGELMDGWRMQCEAPECKRKLASEQIARSVQKAREIRDLTGKWPSQSYTHECTCEVCGKTWTSRDRNTRFCSGTCANSVRTWAKTCERCGTQWTAKAPTARFCSSACYAAERDQRAIAERAPHAQIVLYAGPRGRRRIGAVVQPPLRKRWYAGFCVDCGEPFIHDQPQTVTCSPRCYTRLSRAKRRAVKKSAFVANVYRKEIFERDKWRCQLCRKPVDRTKSVPHPKAPVLDHIIPLAKGGTHEPANVQCAHFLCNSLKSDGGSGEQLLLIG